MKCAKCHFENPDGLVFCGKCGGKLEKVCPKCNFSNPLGFMHCGKCGNSLEKLQAAPPLDYSKPKSYTPRFLADKITEKVSKRLGEDGVIELLLRKLVWGGMGKGLTDCEDCHWIKLTGREKSAINRHDEFFLVIVAYQILTIMQDFIW